MKLYTETDLIDLVQSLKDYTHESHSILGHDERDAKDFVDIFLEDRTPIELPSDEEIDTASLMISKDRKEFLMGANYIINKIQRGNNEQ